MGSYTNTTFPAKVRRVLCSICTLLPVLMWAGLSLKKMISDISLHQSQFRDLSYHKINIAYHAVAVGHSGEIAIL